MLSTLCVALLTLAPRAVHYYPLIPAAAPLRCPPPRLTSVRPTAASVMDWLNTQLSRSRDIRCPFFRRRAGDLIEGAMSVANFVLSRHKSLPLPNSPFSTYIAHPKRRGACIADVMEAVRDDIEERRYYVSGKLSHEFYCDECFFDGPDPDMPVTSLQRYSDALRGLFHPSLSQYELLEMRQVGSHAFVASWRLEGALRLPGRPKIKPYVGTTLYELNEDGLVCSHTETWSISAIDAFLSVAFPTFGAEPAPPAENIREQLRCAHSDEHRLLYIPAAPLPRLSKDASM